METLPRLTEQDDVELRALSERPDSEIDFSDSPEWTDEQWSRAKRGVFVHHRTEQPMARVDLDIANWLRGEGEDFEGRMNAILRREMEASLQQK